jgi:hypothetical protein
MSERVSTFLNLEMRGFRYVFILVTWNDFISDIRIQVEAQIDAFGEALGEEGTVVQSFKSASGKNYKQVLAKEWSEPFATRMREDPDPFMLVIDEDFKDFDPGSHQWSIIRFSDFGEDPQAVYRLFAALARKVESGENIHAYLLGLARKEKYKKWSKYFALKTPELFGVSIDCKAIIEDVVLG